MKDKHVRKVNLIMSAVVLVMTAGLGLIGYELYKLDC